MKLARILLSQQDEITRDAARRIGRSSVSHYWSIGEAEKIERITSLFRTVISCIEKRDLSDMLKYSRKLADDRFADQYKLHELHAVFNTLEEIIWLKITEFLDPSEYADALGLVSTIFSLGKDILAKEYVTLTAEAASRRKPVLNLS